MSTSPLPEAAGALAVLSSRAPAALAVVAAGCLGTASAQEETLAEVVQVTDDGTSLLVDPSSAVGGGSLVVIAVMLIRAWDRTVAKLVAWEPVITVRMDPAPKDED